MNTLWYALPVTVIGYVLILMVVGFRYLQHRQNPPLWLQFACIIPFMIFSFRYWYLPIDVAACMFSGIYDACAQYVSRQGGERPWPQGCTD